jgi:hypothetical protein
LKAEYDQAKLEASAVYQRMEDKKTELVSILEDEGRDSYKSPYGNFSFKYIETCKVPKETSDREAFFGYLKERGVYEDLITVNSATLNAFYKGEVESYGDEFEIPGIIKSEPYARVSMRKS